MINCMANVTQRIPKGYKCPFLANRIIRKAHHPYYEIWEMWGTEFSLRLWKPMSRPNAKWKPLVTQVTAWEALSSSNKRPEVWGTGHQWLKKAFEMVVNGTSSTGREMRGSWARQSKALIWHRYQKGERKTNYNNCHLWKITMSQVLYTHISVLTPSCKLITLPSFCRGGNWDLHYPDGKWQTENSIIVGSDSKV